MSIQEVATGSDTTVKRANESNKVLEEMTNRIKQVVQTSPSVSNSTKIV
ncbi:hypothetical protein [Alkalihalobacillus deserti]|nr:hypothetical protein [Alkalihalobacillus deserti]